MSDVLIHSDVAIVKKNPKQNPLDYSTDRSATELRIKAITEHLIDEAAIVSLQSVLAEVTHVIYNEDFLKGDQDTTHIGCIKVKPSVAEFSIMPTANAWIKPLDSQVRSYPIVGEHVSIINYGYKTYYFQPVNIHNRVSQNIMLLNDGGTHNGKIDKAALPEYLNFFDYQTNPSPVTQHPGDWALNGRNDQSIRFGIDYLSIGARNQKYLDSSNAVIKMRISNPSLATKDKPAGSTRVEDIDTDKSSLYMTRLEDIKFNVTPTVEKITDRTTAGAAAIILDSDRIIFNTKQSDNMGQIDIFAGNTVNIVSKKNTNIIGDVVKLGDSNDDNLQSAVLGESLVNFLSQLIQRLDNLAKDLGSVTGIGNVGGIVPIPAAMAAGSKLGGWTSSTTKTIIANQILSRNIKVSKKKRPNL